MKSAQAHDGHSCHACVDNQGFCHMCGRPIDVQLYHTYLTGEYVADPSLETDRKFEHLRAQWWLDNPCPHLSTTVDRALRVSCQNCGEWLNAPEEPNMKHYIEAYYADGTQLLGNLDGQTVLRARIPQRTNVYKTRKSGRYLDNRIISKVVHHWKLVTEEGREVETILNPEYVEQ